MNILEMILSYKEELEKNFNESIENEILKNLQDLKDKDYQIPIECKNLFKQAYNTTKSVEILLDKNLLVDCNSLLRTCLENIITSTMIAINENFYNEFKNLAIKEEERKFSIQCVRNLFKNELKKIDEEMFGDISNRRIQEMLDELYNKLCNFTHSSIAINLTLEMCENGDDDILKFSIKLTLAFLKLLLNSCMKYFTKNEIQLQYMDFPMVMIGYLSEIDVQKYKDGRMEKYKELTYIPINEAIYENDRKNTGRVQRESNELFKLLQEHPKEIEKWLEDFLKY